jgi:hypothetical protein
MTPRERVLKAVSFQEPDRVPIDLGGMKASGISAFAYDRLKKLLETFAPGGGYVFNQVHNIQANVPPGNVEAMLSAAYEYRGPGTGCR